MDTNSFISVKDLQIFECKKKGHEYLKCDICVYENNYGKKFKLFCEKCFEEANNIKKIEQEPKQLEQVIDEITSSIIDINQSSTLSPESNISGIFKSQFEEKVSLDIDVILQTFTELKELFKQFEEKFVEFSQSLVSQVRAVVLPEEIVNEKFSKMCSNQNIQDQLEILSDLTRYIDEDKQNKLVFDYPTYQSFVNDKLDKVQKQSEDIQLQVKFLKEDLKKIIDTICPQVSEEDKVIVEIKEEKKDDQQIFMQDLKESLFRSEIRRLMVPQSNQISNYQTYLQFDQLLKSPSIVLELPNTIMQNFNQEDDEDVFSLLDPALDFENISQWGFQILHKKYRSIRLGICYESIVRKNNFSFQQFRTLNHGCYLVSSTGASFSSYQDLKNNKNACFEFNFPDTIYLIYDPKQNQLQFKKNDEPQSFTLQIDPEAQEDLKACVLLEGRGSKVELINNHQLNF